LLAMLPNPAKSSFVFSLGIMFYIAVTIYGQNKQPRPTPGLLYHHRRKASQI
jgi:hypothetical protein